MPCLRIKSVDNARARRSLTRAKRRFELYKIHYLKHFFRRFVRRTGSFASDLRCIEAIRPELALARTTMATRTEPALVERRARALRKLFGSGENLLLSKEARYHRLKTFQIRKAVAVRQLTSRQLTSRQHTSRQLTPEDCDTESLIVSELNKPHKRCDRPKHLVSAFYTDRRLRKIHDKDGYSDSFMKEILSGAELTLANYQMNLASSKGWRKLKRADSDGNSGASNGRRVRWMLDSGANGWLVPMFLNGELNPCIVKLHDKTRPIGTASGEAVATVATLATPFGLRTGNVIPQPIPHLCPMSDVLNDGFLYWRGDRMPVFKYSGRVVPLQLCYGILDSWKF